MTVGDVGDRPVKDARGPRYRREPACFAVCIPRLRQAGAMRLLLQTAMIMAAAVLLDRKPANPSEDDIKQAGAGRPSLCRCGGPQSGGGALCGEAGLGARPMTAGVLFAAAQSRKRRASVHRPLSLCLPIRPIGQDCAEPAVQGLRNTIAGWKAGYGSKRTRPFQFPSSPARPELGQGILHGLWAQISGRRARLSGSTRLRMISTDTLPRGPDGAVYVR